VEGVKGPGGGYALRRSPESILVGDIVRAMEGPIAPVQCIIRDREDVCDRIKLCATHVLWEDLADVISGFLDSITLADLCAKTRQLRQEKKENA
jgi:Rrf2 family protein